MRRSLFAASLFVVALFLFHATPAVRAQTPTQFQTISSPKGYQFEVPQDWQQETPVGRADIQIATTNNAAVATVVINDAPRSTPPDPLQALQAYLQAATNGGVFGQISSVLGPGPIQVSGADAAARLSFAFSSTTGSTDGMIVTAAVSGTRLYYLNLLFSTVYGSRHLDDLGYVLASFSLVGARSNSFMNYTGNDYSVSVPSAWRQARASGSAGVLFESPDHMEVVSVDVFDPGLGPSPDPVDVLNNSVFPTFAQHWPDFAILKGPDPVNVTNADSAAFAVATYTDNNGVPYVVTFVVALRGNTAYLLNLDVPASYFQANVDQLVQLASSFHLAP